MMGDCHEGDGDIGGRKFNFNLSIDGSGARNFNLLIGDERKTIR